MESRYCLFFWVWPQVYTKNDFEFVIHVFKEICTATNKIQTGEEIFSSVLPIYVNRVDLIIDLESP